MNESQIDEVAAFLRRWLPEGVRAEYRRIMAADPAGWPHHPHFAGGLIVRHALRGNGVDEHALGVPSLEPLWREALARAVADPADASAPEQPHDAVQHRDGDGDGP